MWDRSYFFSDWLKDWNSALKYLVGTIATIVAAILTYRESGFLIFGALVLAYFSLLFSLRTAGEILENLNVI